MGKGSPGTGYRLPVGANDEPPRRPYKPTTRVARMALSSEEGRIIREGAERVRGVIALEEQWKDVED